MQNSDENDFSKNWYGNTEENNFNKTYKKRRRICMDIDKVCKEKCLFSYEWKPKMYC